jgi:exopolyphosphatase/guanosine-5'-triphosphate,3'-diphosphate pyrophosphatase
MRAAAFDLGTNSFLCLVVEKTETGYKEIYDESRVVRLGQDMYVTGKPILHKDALERAKNCLYDYKKAAEQLGATKYKAVATSAARDAENAKELLDICEELGIELEIITGKREASLSFIGSFAPAESNSDTMVVDVGGGSTEFLFSEGNETLVESLNIGAVRLTEKFISSNPIAQEELEAARAFAREQIKTLNLNTTPKYLRAVAGTPTTLAAVMLSLEVFDKDKIDGFVLNKSNLEEYIFKLSKLTLTERLRLPGMQKGREDVIVCGMLILLEVLEHFSLNDYRVSTRGVRYGLAAEILS